MVLELKITALVVLSDLLVNPYNRTIFDHAISVLVPLMFINSRLLQALKIAIKLRFTFLARGELSGWLGNQDVRRKQ